MRTRAGMAVLAAVASVGMLTAPSATAAEQAPRVSGTGPHCVAQLETNKTTCYKTFRESVAAATGGRVTDATQEKAARTPNFVDQLNKQASTRTSRTTANTSLVAIMYEDPYYSGASSISVAPGPCTSNGSWDWEWRSIATGWNDRVSSFKLYSDCHLNAFEHFDFGGASQYFGTDTSSLGLLDNQISSYRLH
ncbi:hypothetical protein ACIQWZ_39805 [Streptomyces sp. NPDC098077]|uniref:hypothetical protein n=1 Tax=Streptomyces sp. NPDC098077 TaxID=3366093 RepID=UPI00381E8EF0